jgi:inhibitor of cysteine peptidase
MLTSCLTNKLTIGALLLPLLLVACGLPGAGPDEVPTGSPTPGEPGTIATTGVQVKRGSFIAFEGLSSLPDGTVLQTELSADGTPVAWWPEGASARVAHGQWQVRVVLGEGGAPEALSEEKAYVLRVWERGHPAVEALPFPFDVAGPPAPETMTGMARVEEVDILIMESFPVQVAVVARGNLPDGCTEIDELRSRYEPESNRFVVEITTVRDAEAVCTQALVPFEERVALDVYGLPAGAYWVDVNGVIDSFTLDMDNAPVEPDGATIPWDEARLMILAGEVEQVTQLHSLQVTLITRDGRRLETVEPEIDDVFDVVKACGDPCADMILATE